MDEKAETAVTEAFSNEMSISFRVNSSLLEISCRGVTVIRDSPVKSQGERRKSEALTKQRRVDIKRDDQNKNKNEKSNRETR